MSQSIFAASRRSFITGSLMTVGSSVLPFVDTRLFAQKASLTGEEFRASGKTAKITSRRLRNNISVLMGSGGNIIVLPGVDGVLTVDSGLSTSRAQIRAALDAISSHPVRHVLNTHWHFDHTDGNEWMHLAGATIVAQENTRKRMTVRQSIPAFSIVLDPSPKAALPTVVFGHLHEQQLNGQRIVMKGYTPAHTDSDVSVFFDHANVLHTGDTWFNGYYPFIDYDSGGSIDGLIAASSENLTEPTLKLSYCQDMGRSAVGPI